MSGTKVSLAIKVMLFVLLAAHGIETNPGPSYSNEKDKLLTSLSTKVNDLFFKKKIYMVLTRG